MTSDGDLRVQLISRRYSPIFQYAGVLCGSVVISIFKYYLNSERDSSVVLFKTAEVLSY